MVAAANVGPASQQQQQRRRSLGDSLASNPGSLDRRASVHSVGAEEPTKGSGGAKRGKKTGPASRGATMIRGLLQPMDYLTVRVSLLAEFETTYAALMTVVSEFRTLHVTMRGRGGTGILEGKEERGKKKLLAGLVVLKLCV